MMNVQEFLSQIRKAVNSRTLYVMGGWGFPLGYPGNKDRTQSQPYNQQDDRKKLIYNASDDTFAFDCCGLPRSILWGWDGDTSKKNGGAVYCANGVPEYDAKQFMFQGCTEQSRDFSKIDPGEFLWLDGHCGVYLGDGLAAESTPIWKDGVQITAVANIGSKSGYNSRTWTYHGHLKYVDYKVQPSPYKNKWVKKDDNWYYYDKDGYMVTSDWIKYKGSWYYVGSDGAMLTGWQTINDKKYYLYEEGHMAHDEWIDGLFLNQDGSQTYSNKGVWKQDKKGKWFEYDSGWYPKSRYVRIDKKDCKFDSNGYLVK